MGGLGKNLAYSLKLTSNSVAAVQARLYTPLIATNVSYKNT